MTYEEREAIFSKDTISYKDLAKLLEIAPSTASNLIQTIKRSTGDRLKIAGKVLVKEYLEYIGVPESQRENYGKRAESYLSPGATEYLKGAKKSLCYAGEKR